ncbi:serine/threonine protein kinase [Reticulibacter mediterranei]|uniref:non-specific serine/threonine protein kinase n=1 Tax=Reticulibacter mediterranei TaxID=2778369 RepID=A0A8J3IMY1_9CHLR|nr:RIO1 family regulatory kinase/ATPase [Reticulibacter mediterranei]GHO95345.1 serine/threonine protein kinase [Reticulibacter mediterranei]
MSKKTKFKEDDFIDEAEEQDPIVQALDTFFDEGLITNVLYEVKSGKEATVYCCEAHPSTGVELLAAKFYRPRQNRNFKNDAVYQEGRVILDSHARRAVANKSRRGREMQFSMWIDHEFEALTALYKAGASTPRPFARASSAILMEYMGDQQQAASALQHVSLEREEVYPLFEQLMQNIELLLSCNYIHGDLSGFNILYWEGQIKIIDFPQTIDPRFNVNAFSLLERDINNVCRYFARYGLQRDSLRLANALWRKFMNAEL